MTDQPDHVDDAAAPTTTEDQHVDSRDREVVVTTAHPGSDDTGVRRFRGILLGIAIARYVIPIAALPLIPVLFPERLELLMLLRPGKETLLAVGGVARTQGSDGPNLVLAFLAFLPLMLVAVWAFFALGRAWQAELETGDGPAWLSRAVPPETFVRLQRLLEERGVAIAFFGRIAALPATIMAAAAGTSTISPRAYLVADFLGAIASFVITVYAGWWLGEAYERGGIWFAVAGFVFLMGVFAWASAWLRREPAPVED